MFPTPRQTARTREQTLTNLHSFSMACLDSSQRICELLAEIGRNSLQRSSRNLDVYNPSKLGSLPEMTQTFWLENSVSPKLVDQVYEIVADTHKAMIEAAEAQIQLFDEIAFASIDQATHYSPWEAQIGFKAMRNTLQSAEQTLHNMSTASIQTLSLTKEEMHQVAEILTEMPKPTPRTRTKAKAAENPATLTG
jgi:hypothetical protein